MSELIGESLFSGLVFWGSELLPPNIVPSLNHLREWAFQNGFANDPDADFVGLERLAELKKHFVADDMLMILVHLTNEFGKMQYLEFPYIPVATLIKKQVWVDIVYWMLRPTSWTEDGAASQFGEVRLGFWYPGVEGDEFATRSNAKLICQRFGALTTGVDAKLKTTLSDVSVDVEADGEVKARFSKVGRLFDVELKSKTGS